MCPSKTSLASYPSRPEVAKPQTVVQIMDIGLCCRFGSETAALFGGVATNMSTARPHPGLMLPAENNPDQLQPIHTGALPEFDDLTSPQDRLLALLEEALYNLLEKQPSLPVGRSLLVILLLPPIDTIRGSQVDHQQIQAFLRSTLPEAEQVEIRLLTPADGSVSALLEACEQLKKGMWDAVLFGGADTLVDTATCLEVMQSRTLLTAGSSGIFPGEAAVFLFLQKTTTAPGLAHITTLAATVEPFPGQADEKSMTGLAEAIRKSTQDDQNTLEPAAVILPLDASACQTLEWHQVRQNLWPNARQGMEELYPCHFLGDIGAATLPLSVALGCARLDFTYSAITSLLVCEAGATPPRGALWLHKPPYPGEAMSRKSSKTVTIPL
ncbi:hypothetical protein [Desulfuromonas sp. AOP6]|uniref:hypothetical protein n=1 Tax=Desulfuromonas sp. AOP6 TaxID=1566351 RepID=UPI001282CA6C|nr:hypothetical protein [Desulfuromonas sp. AOP6]BCA78390.1 hypothetical protein AOP6_0177 [Desulfuromonas sp. AOP6]